MCPAATSPGSNGTRTRGNRWRVTTSRTRPRIRCCWTGDPNSGCRSRRRTRAAPRRVVADGVLPLSRLKEATRRVARMTSASRSFAECLYADGNDPVLTPMLATAADVLPTGTGWTYEIKWDGYRALAA